MKRFAFMFGLAAMVVNLLFVTASAAPLSDAEMYCDPWSVPTAVYSKIYLDNLNVTNSFTWTADNDPVTQAQILPIIKQGTYQVGYVFSDSDYYHTPNVDYFADLQSGTLTATLTVAGVYHVRVIRQSGQSDVYAVLAQSQIGPDSDETGANKNIGIPNADLFIVSDSAGDDDFEETCKRVLEKMNKTVKRATSVEEAATAINALDVPPKKHVELVGHGVPGAISLGNGMDLNSGTKVLDKKNAESFREAIKAKVSHLTFLSCDTGFGAAGAALIDILDDGIDSVQAYDSEVIIVEEMDDEDNTTKGYFTTSITASNVPEPATIVMIGCAIVAMAGIVRKKFKV